MWSREDSRIKYVDEKEPACNETNSVPRGSVIGRFQCVSKSALSSVVFPVNFIFNQY
jgi:hypothetical protein